MKFCPDCGEEVVSLGECDWGCHDKDIKERTFYGCKKCNAVFRTSSRVTYPVLRCGNYDHYSKLARPLDEFIHSGCMSYVGKEIRLVGELNERRLVSEM